MNFNFYEGVSNYLETIVNIYGWDQFFSNLSTEQQLELFKVNKPNILKLKEDIEEMGESSLISLETWIHSLGLKYELKSYSESSKPSIAHLINEAIFTNQRIDIQLPIPFNRKKIFVIHKDDLEKKFI